MKDYYIEKVHAREILDSRGNPTVMVEAHINGKELQKFHQEHQQDNLKLLN